MNNLVLGSDGNVYGTTFGEAANGDGTNHGNSKPPLVTSASRRVRWSGKGSYFETLANPSKACDALPQ